MQRRQPLQRLRCCAQQRAAAAHGRRQPPLNAALLLLAVAARPAGRLAQCWKLGWLQLWCNAPCTLHSANQHPDRTCAARPAVQATPQTWVGAASCGVPAAQRPCCRRSQASPAATAALPASERPAALPSPGWRCWIPACCSLQQAERMILVGKVRCAIPLLPQSNVFPLLRCIIAAPCAACIARQANPPRSATSVSPSASGCGAGCRGCLRCGACCSISSRPTAAGTMGWKDCVRSPMPALPCYHGAAGMPNLAHQPGSPMPPAGAAVQMSGPAAAALRLPARAAQQVSRQGLLLAPALAEVAARQLAGWGGCCCSPPHLLPPSGAAEPQTPPSPASMQWRAQTQAPKALELEG